MKVVFRDNRLGVIETEGATRLLKKIPATVIKATRKRLAVMRAAPDERTLRNWKSLHYEKLGGDRKGQRSIRINDQWRIVFKLDNSADPPIISVLSIEDYH
jgi:proteic killer suppression protein